MKYTVARSPHFPFKCVSPTSHNYVLNPQQIHLVLKKVPPKKVNRTTTTTTTLFYKQTLYHIVHESSQFSVSAVVVVKFVVKK